ncbi:unnamed protein product [Eruca vesicaria subsp. sativa]|uniref:Uncharacterized protein n=1 Tax=Eruca vesicaria subsp. sativa TaxID=29727 RepID=A0ABC8KT65_ERUVS|nr:unnamed protein product [Eruca vesicaria subsp. sativa]
MNIHRASSSETASRMRQTRLPPGATRPATSSASRHPLPSLAAVMSSPERRLHLVLASTNKMFRIDDCIRKDVVATYQSNFWGPWWNYNMVPQEKKDAWWTSFVMATNTKGRVYGLGSLQYVDAEPKESPAASLRRSVGVDGRLTTVEGVVTGLKDDFSGLKQSIDLLLRMNGVDPVTHQPIPRESGASAPSPHSDSSQELNQHSPTH